MRMSMRFGKTLRESPAEAELPSHKLMLRAGFIAKVAAGIYDYMPFAWRTARKIEEIMRNEMNAILGQEVLMPVVNPAELWQETGRWQTVGPEMVRMKDRSGRDMVLAMTHEETMTDLARRYVDSYKQLPMVVYHIQTKFRDEPRPRAGLIRVREFIMKDAYSFHADQAGLDEYYPNMCRAYRRICLACGVPVVQVLGDVGMMGGTNAHEFAYVTEYGEDTLLMCPKCGYASNRDTATIRKELDDNMVSNVPSPEMVATPGKNTIADVGEFLGVDTKRTMKSMVYLDGESGLVMVVIRGDLDVNDRKLANLLHLEEVRLAEESDLKKAGLSQGYMSPVGLTGVKIVCDDSLNTSQGYVAGANEPGFHLKNVVPGRDFSMSHRGDFAAARQGDPCPVCGSPLEVKRGVEIGNTFKLGTRYSGTMGANFLDEQGKSRPLVMGCYGMGLGRLLACVVEANHDERGIIWPMSVAPYHIYIVALGASSSVKEQASALYSDLTAKGFEVVLDDRDESAGVKFNDADLLGMPVRITLSERSLKAGGVELKMRTEKSPRIVTLSELEGELKRIIDEEMRRLSPDEVI